MLSEERIEKVMPSVREAIERHIEWPSDEFTDIYNRCWEAVAAALRNADQAIADAVRDANAEKSKYRELLSEVQKAITFETEEDARKSPYGLPPTLANAIYQVLVQAKETGVPGANSDQVMISINWRELHILCVWAERWAKNSNIPIAPVYEIAHRLEDQFPERDKLTLAGELSEIKRLYPGLQTNIPGIE